MNHVSSHARPARFAGVLLPELLVVVVLVSTGCVSLPDANQQASALARQSFGPGYQFAITSYYKETEVQANLTNQIIESFATTSSTALRQMQFASATRRESNSGRLSAMADFYNTTDYVSEIEKKFGDALEVAFNVTPVYLSRPEIEAMLDDEVLESSAMIHARELATRKGYDAVLVVYFEPILSELAAIPQAYALSYKALVAVRSIADDRLLYLRDGNYRCANEQVFSAYSGGSETLEAMKQCEEQIHAGIVGDFLEFARSAGISIGGG